MRQLQMSPHLQCPWLCIGDWNELLDPSEKQKGIYKNLAHIAQFRHLINYLYLSDNGFQGYFFTRKKGTGPNQILERLDRGLASNSRKQLFPKAVL